MLDPCASRILRADLLDAGLQEAADGGPILLRPGVRGLAQQPRPRLHEAVRTVGVGHPAQAELHPGAGRSLSQLGVGVGQPALGGRDQLLQSARDLVDEVVLEDLALAFVK